MEGLVVKGKGPGWASDGEEDGASLRLPFVSLPHFSQDELVQLSRAQGCRLADTYFSQIVVPSLDRNAFNESVGSKKQTYRNWEDYWPKQAESKEEGGRAGAAGVVKQQGDREAGDREEDEQVGGKRKHRRKKTTQQRLINRPVYSEKRKKRGTRDSAVAEVTPPLKTWTSPRRAPACEAAGNTVFVDTGMGGLDPARAADQGNQQQGCKPKRTSRLGRSTIDGTGSAGHGRDVDEKQRVVAQVREDDDEEGASVPVTIIPSGRSQGLSVPFEIRAVREDLASDVQEDAKPPAIFNYSLQGFSQSSDVGPVAFNSVVSQATFDGGRDFTPFQSAARVFEGKTQQLMAEATISKPSSALPFETTNIRDLPATAQSAQVTSDESIAFCKDSAVVGGSAVEPMGSSRGYLPWSQQRECTGLPFENGVVREDPVAQQAQLSLDNIRKNHDIPLPFQCRQAACGDCAPIQEAPVQFESGAGRGDLVAQTAQLTPEDVRKRQGFPFPFPFGTRAAHFQTVPSQSFHGPFEGIAVREASVAGDGGHPRLEVRNSSPDLPLPFSCRAQCEDCVAELAMGPAAAQLLNTEVATTLELVPAEGSRNRRAMGTFGITESVESVPNFQHLHVEPMQMDVIPPAKVGSESCSMITNHVTPGQFTHHPLANNMPMGREAALTDMASHASNEFENVPEVTISYVQLALEASNPEGELSPEDTMSPGKIAPMASTMIPCQVAPSLLEIASTVAMSPVEIATEDGDMRWHLKDSEVSAAPIASASEVDYAPIQCVQCVQCVQCEADVASMHSFSETDADDSMLRQAEVNAAAIASGLCAMGWMKEVVLEAATGTSAEMGCMTSGLYHLDMNAASADTSFDSSDTNLQPVDNEMRTEKYCALQADPSLIGTVPAYQTNSDCTQLLKGDSASGDSNLEPGKEKTVYCANTPVIGEGFFVANTSQSTGTEHEQGASGGDGGILMLERFIQMMSQGHSKEFSKPKLESRGGKRKLTHTDYLPTEETQSKRFQLESPQASYLNSEDRGVVHEVECEQFPGSSDKPQPLEVCTEDTNGVRESNESIGESSEQERNYSAPVVPGVWQPRATWVAATKEVHIGEPEQSQQPSSASVGVSQSPAPLLSWRFPPIPQPVPAVAIVVPAVDQSCESGVTHEVVHTDLPEQETCNDVTELKQVINVSNVQTQCTADAPTSPRQPKLKAEMERRLAAIEGKWLTDRRKVVVADNFPEGWTVCVFLRTKGGRATLEYRSWKSPEGKVFGTFKDAADHVQATTGVLVKNRGILKTEQAREKKNLQPGGVVASQEAAPLALLHDCRICGSKFTSEAALMQHRVVHDLSYTELRELSHLQKLEAQKSTPSVALVPRLEGPIAEEKATADITPCLPSKSNVPPTQDKVVITCSICSGTFSCKKNLRRHIQRRHSDNQYKGLPNANKAVSRPDLQNVQPPPHCVS